jgi:hypothetical protein
MSERPILAEARTPEGTRVVLFEDTWLRHILLPKEGIQSLSPISLPSLQFFPTPIIASRTYGRHASASSSRMSGLASG